jgi:hypothetical protein
MARDKTPDYGKWILDGLQRNPRLSKSGLSHHLGHGVDRSRVLKMINGRRRIQVDEIPQIAAYLGIPPPDLPIKTTVSEAAGIRWEGAIMPGVWVERGMEAPLPTTAIPPVIDARYPAGEQSAFEMTADCPAESLRARDVLITIPIKRSRIDVGELVVAQRTRDTLSQFVLARVEADKAGRPILTPRTGGATGDSGEPIAKVIGVFRLVG